MHSMSMPSYLETRQVLYSFQQRLLGHPAIKDEAQAAVLNIHDAICDELAERQNIISAQTKLKRLIAQPDPDEIAQPRMVMDKEAAAAALENIPVKPSPQTIQSAIHMANTEYERVAFSTGGACQIREFPVQKGGLA